MLLFFYNFFILLQAEVKHPAACLPKYLTTVCFLFVYVAIFFQLLNKPQQNNKSLCIAKYNNSD